eukprot:TRINITY_DN763_c0_g2_i1.p1 TRINITY_DN763_c0_g2~~TRINITY_DN763_c0_g2_i1.p1  ORF type:complete len:402 (+),score=25.57 TRINITY_DN763_c0_g2_i1:845-2050(+)
MEGSSRASGSRQAPRLAEGSGFLPGLPDDLALLCIARVPARRLPHLARVSRTYRSLLLSSPSVLWKHRKSLGLQTHAIAMLSQKTESRFTLNIYDFTDKVWTICPVPAKLKDMYGCGGVAIENFIYFFGGEICFSPGDGGMRFTRELWRYNVYTETWKRLADMKRGRGADEYGLVEGRIVVVGGIQEAEDGSPDGSYEVYEPSEDVWKLVKLPHEMLEGLGVLFSVSIGDSLYLYPHGLKILPRQQTFARNGDEDVAGDKWLPVMVEDDSLTYDMGCMTVSVAFHLGRLFRIEQTPHSTLFVFTDKWRETGVSLRLRTPGFKIHNFELVASPCGSRLFVVGNGYFVGEVKCRGCWDLDVVLETVSGRLEGQAETRILRSGRRSRPKKSWSWRHLKNLGLLI